MFVNPVKWQIQSNIIVTLYLFVILYYFYFVLNLQTENFLLKMICLYVTSY